MKKEITYRILLAHSAFWAISFFILFKIFTRDYNNHEVDLVYTALFHIPLLVVVYVNLMLIRIFFHKEKYLNYGFLALALMLCGAGIHYLVFNYLSTQWLNGFYFVSLLSWVEIFTYMLVYVIVSLLLSLSVSWFQLREKQSHIEAQAREVQLKNLKAQLNPHFLFNSLNNIYALIDNSANLSKTYMLRLSDALRYMLYKTGDKYVPLTEELEYISNYVELEKLRLEPEAKIRFDTALDTDKGFIAPLILLPLVENCFKHCNKDEPHIDISIVYEKDILEIKCINNLTEETSSQESGGIGLINLRSRLDLIYQDQYSWDTEIKDGYYRSKLTLKLS